MKTTKTTDFDLKQSDEGLYILTIEGQMEILSTLNELAEFLLNHK